MGLDADPDITEVTDILLDSVARIQATDERTADRVPVCALLCFVVIASDGTEKWDYRVSADLSRLTAASWGEAIHDLELGAFLDQAEEDPDG